MMKIFKCNFAAAVSAVAILVGGCSAQDNSKNFTESKGSPYRTGQNPADLILADLNNDGRLDIATANAQGRSVSIFLNEGNGTFRQSDKSTISVKFAPHLIAAGDLNSDGKMDLTLTDHDSYEVLILLGDGQGGFAQSGTTTLALEAESAHNHGLGLADFNRDGEMDIATSNNGDNSVSVLLGDGKGSFTQMQGSPFPVGTDPYPFSITDVNRDNRLDILVSNLNGRVSLLQSDGKDSFKSAADISVSPRPYFLTTGDFNNDSLSDFVTSHDDITTLSIMLGDGKGGFLPSPGSPLNVRQRVWKMVSHNLNGDGNSDLVLAGQTENEILVLYGDASGNFSLNSKESHPAGNQPSGLAVGDLNADGKPDIVFCNSRSHNVSVLLQD